MIRVLTLALMLTACGADDPSDTAGGDDGQCVPQEARDGGVARPEADPCPPAADDFPGEGWQACISDDGAWHLAGEETPSSAARVAAYEAIAALLWRNDCIPGPEEFIEAQGIYGEDGGVGSRVSRRYDARIDKPEGADCKAEDAGERWADYCVGPARIEPRILTAFAKGIAGDEPSLQAGRIRSGLLWFYWVSTYKEAFTCATARKDCDSAWAYYTGGKQASETALGLGGEVAALHPAIHQAVFDGLLAVRCWRDLDAGEQAGDDALHARALAQLDRALQRAWEALDVPDAPTVTDACL